MSELATRLLIWGWVIHLLADLFMQNEWMANNKTSLRHPSSWVHAAIHAVLLLIVFPWPAAILLGVSHLLIDTRKPLEWWRRIYRQTLPRTDMTPAQQAGFLSFAFAQDQAAHVLCLAVAALIVAR